MNLLLIVILSLVLQPRDRYEGSLSSKDYLLGPIPFNTRFDSLLVTLGPPIEVTRAEGYCGKGPITRGTLVLEGDTTYCDSITTYGYDSLTICLNLDGTLESYSFTTTKFKTARGISIGDTKQEVLSLYGNPTWMDSAYVFDEFSAPEDDAVQYVGRDDYFGMEFFFVHGRVHRIYIGRGSGC